MVSSLPGVVWGNGVPSMEHGGQREGTAHLPTDRGLVYCGGMVTTWCWWWWRAGGGAREDRTGGSGKMSERRPIVFFYHFGKSLRSVLDNIRQTVKSLPSVID